jgi:hypothetical protein
VVREILLFSAIKKETLTVTVIYIFTASIGNDANIGTQEYNNS